MTFDLNQPEEPDTDAELLGGGDPVVRNSVFGVVGALAQAGVMHVHAAPPLPVPVVPRQLPAVPALFAGRVTELARLDQALTATTPGGQDEAGQEPARAEMRLPGATVVVSAIGGAGGIGKTWMALAWAHRHLHRFPDGQLFVDLHGFSPTLEPKPPEVAVRGFLDALGVDPSRIPTDLDAQAALYRSLVADRRMLILLDNAATAEQVIPLLPGGPTCTVLITGRIRLASLIDRHGALHLQLDVLGRTEARALLTARLGADWVNAESGAVDELVELCGGYPLALSVTARNAVTRPGLPLAEVVAELRELGLEVLDHDTDPAASLFTALGELRRATVAISYAMLARQAAAQRPPLKISGKRLSDWFLGKAVPADPAVLRFLVEYLQPRASGASGFQQRPLLWWLNLHQHAVQQRPAKRDDGGHSAVLPRSHRLPRVWRVPTRNASFTGRVEALSTVGLALQTGLAPSIAVLHGIGGVGKTSLAVEYAYRHADLLDVIWWVDAEEPESAMEQFAALAVELGVASEDSMAKRGAAEARNWLQRHAGWLVILDDVPSSDLARDLIPAGPGRVLITSRDTRWSTIGAVIDVDVFSREESVSLLRAQNPAMSDADADRVAAAVDDLPLAVAQAAGFISETGMPVGEYVSELEVHANDLLGEGRPATYPRSAASVVALSAERLAGTDQAALGLLHLCVFLGPDPVPMSWFTGAESMRPVRLRAAVGRLARMGLARRTAEGDALVVHRTTAAIVRDILPVSERRALLTRLQEILVSVRQGEPDAVHDWPAWALLALHVAFLQNVSSGAEEIESPEFRALVLTTARYLELAGHARAANEMATRARVRWSSTLGDDHLDTMWAAHRQSATLPPAHPDALQIEEELYARKIRLLGPDDPDTLATAGNLALALADLGQHDAARRLDEENLARRHRVFGQDDSRTLTTMDNLANRLSDLGDPQGAKDLRDSVLATRRRVLGDDHLDTLRSRIGLARDLARLGRLAEAAEAGDATRADATRVLGTDHRLTLVAAATLAGIARERGDAAQARLLGEDILDRRRATLGADHPETVATAINLAADMAGLGETVAAEDLRRQFAIEPPA